MPEHKTLQHILAKTASLLVVVAVFLLCGTVVVTAQENNGVFAKHDLQLDLQSNLTANATYTIDITNNNDSLVDSFTLQLPFNDVHNATLSIDGANIAITAQPIAGGTSFTSEFPGEAILSHTSKKLTLQFITGVIAQRQFGMTQLYLSKITADHVVTDFGLTVNYPNDFPQLRYTSSFNLSSKLGTVQLIGLNGQLIQWGDKMSGYISETVPVDVTRGQENLLFNLLSDGRYQSVQYAALQNLDTAAQDKWGNLWGIAHQQNAVTPITYSLGWVIQPTELTDATAFPNIDYNADEVDLPTELQSVTFGKTKQEQLQALYDYMLHSFSATAQNFGDKISPRDTLAQLKQGDHVLSDFKYAYIMAALCQKLKLQCNVVYGYLVGPSFAQIDTSRPYVWVEALSDDDKLIILDPYLHVTTGGFNFFDATQLGRLKVGIWDPALSQDSVLGLLNGVPRIRPLLSEEATLPDDSGTYTLQSFFPPQVKGGEFYFGYLVFQNDSNSFVPVKSLIFNGQDITQQLLEVTSKLQRVMLPFATNRIDIEWQREPNFLSDQTVVLQTILTPVSDLQPPVEADSTIVFIPNSGALLAVMIVIILIAIGIIAFLVKLWLQHVKIGINLRKRYKQRKAANSPVQPEPATKKTIRVPDRTVHRISER